MLKDVRMLVFQLELMMLPIIICIINSWLLIQSFWLLDHSTGHFKLEVIIKRTLLLLMENSLSRNTMQNSTICGLSSLRMNLNMLKTKLQVSFRKDIEEIKLRKKVKQRESQSIQTTLGASNENKS